MSYNNQRPPNMGSSTSAPGRRSIGFNLEFCEPVAVNAAVFVALILVDLYNKNNTLIPLHAIAGILITLMTLGLCRSQYIAAAWGFAALPAIFLIVTFLMAASQNKYVLDAEKGIKSVYNTVSGDVQYGYNTAVTDINWAANAAVNDVNSINTYGSNAYSSAAKSIGDTWTSIFNAKVAAGATPEHAAAAASAATGTAPGATTTISGEYAYICNPASADPEAAAGCTACLRDHGDKDMVALDRCIGIALKTSPICLGSLGTARGQAPSASTRDACLACTDPNKSTNEQNACRTTAMGGTPTAGAAGFSNYEPFTSQPASTK